MLPIHERTIRNGRPEPFPGSYRPPAIRAPSRSNEAAEALIFMEYTGSRRSASRAGRGEPVLRSRAQPTRPPFVEGWQCLPADFRQANRAPRTHRDGVVGRPPRDARPGTADQLIRVSTSRPAPRHRVNRSSCTEAGYTLSSQAACRQRVGVSRRTGCRGLRNLLRAIGIRTATGDLARIHDLRHNRCRSRPCVLPRIHTSDARSRTKPLRIDETASTCAVRRQQRAWGVYPTG